MSPDADVRKLLPIALDAMKSTGPRPLLKRLALEADAEGLAWDSPETDLNTAVDEDAVDGGQLKGRLRQELALWDASDATSWTDGSAARTPARRIRVYDALALPAEMRGRWDALFPSATHGDDVVISRDFEPWYENSLSERPPFYWDHYQAYLAKRGWHADAVASLGRATTRVVERLADPEREDAYQAKGLVVGYVQSGKTANFTGVIAKAIDAGYRLILVLTGTTDLLRTQTQRRLDKELVGVENLLREVNAKDPDAVAKLDYWGAPDWDEFVRHGELPSRLGRPEIRRLTTTSSDYQALKQGIEALDFTLIDPSKPLNSPENLRRLPARVAIVKKNGSVLERFVEDLNKITAQLSSIPALVIDDESDQASLNTQNPKRWKAGSKTRTAINGHISDLIRLLPRGQYIGYTATPFANVFVDPIDTEDIFPSNFILSLDRPPGYMGARDFHDLDGVPDPPSFTNSNELAYVRDVVNDVEHATLAKAVDAFVLSGAIKLFREAAGAEIDTRHHTMLVHQSVAQADHRAIAKEVEKIWLAGGWMQPWGAARLRELYDEDFLPVMNVRSEGQPVPRDFDDVRKFIGTAAHQIAGSDNRPAWIVNGDAQVAEHNIDFGARSIWKIFIGGTKLSRGFTIEGLTVSYYVRLTTQADTLMQMGRWFGFRPGYRDLVRLFIGRSSGSGTGRDIYEAFEAACRSEEMFREEIARYSTLVDGCPQITPAQVPPIVAQYVYWLKPTAVNKMYNAILVERRSPGTSLEPAGYASDARAVAQNAEKIRPLIEAANISQTFALSATRDYKAFVGVVTHAELIAAITNLKWSPEDHFAPDLEWLRGLGADKIRDWAIIVPQLVGDDATRTVFELKRSVHQRQRRDDRPGFGAIADPKHRRTAQRVADLPGTDQSDPAASAMRADKRGAVLIYPVFETKPGHSQEIPAYVKATSLIMALVIATPVSTGSPDQPRVRFRTRDPKNADAIIDV